MSTSNDLPDTNANAHGDPTAEGASSSGPSLEIDVCSPVPPLGLPCLTGLTGAVTEWRKRGAQLDLWRFCLWRQSILLHHVGYIFSL